MFIVASDTDGYVGSITLIVCDSAANPPAVRIHVDTNGNNSIQPPERNVVVVDLTAAGCGSSTATIPAGADRIALETGGAIQSITVVLQLSQSTTV
jgi:hypothetical protein